MDAVGRGAVGKSLGSAKGFPYLRGSAFAYRVRRTALTLVAIAALVTAVWATSAAFEGHADAGVFTDVTGRFVAGVSPTGFAWRDGVRPGQQVVSVGRSDDPAGWNIVTLGPVGRIESRAAPIESALRESLPFAVLGLAAAALALVFLRTNRDWVLPAAGVSLLGSSVPLILANGDATTITLLLAAVVPVGGIAWRFRLWRPLAGAATLGVVVLLVAWWITRSSGDSGAEAVERLRRVVAVGGTGLLFVDRALARAGLGGTSEMTRVKLLTDAGAVILVGGTLALLYLGAFPAPVIAVGLVLGLLAAFPVRAYVGRRIEYALIADLRQHLTADVVEEERSRLARELHDVPLQQLSGVIRRLELVPEAKEETGSLQAIADELRAVAIDLRPPMLDDLGLGAALDFLAEQSANPGIEVEATINDATGPYRRPPASVELAVYRIAHEAVANALNHANAHHVTIAASIGTDAIELEIADDGVGLPADAARRASSRGRLGLASMRRRAQAIDADFSIDGSDGGTRVGLTWRA
jgi:signal transduction histidine kinase